MQNNILIPTDFSIQSLNLLKHAMEKTELEEAKIYLVIGFYLPESITNLLFFSQGDIFRAAMTHDFSEACKIIRNKYQSKLKGIENVMFTGNRQAAFNNFVKAHQISEAYIPGTYQLKDVHYRSFDCVPFFRKADIPVHEVEWKLETQLPEKDLVAELFAV